MLKKRLQSLSGKVAVHLKQQKKNLRSGKCRTCHSLFYTMHVTMRISSFRLIKSWPWRRTSRISATTFLKLRTGRPRWRNTPKLLGEGINLRHTCVKKKKFSFLLFLYLNLSIFHHYYSPKDFFFCCFCSPAVLHCRYLEFCGNVVDDESAQKKLEPTALSCILNTAACKLKLQQWQEAVESCDEVHRKHFWLPSSF